MTIGVIKMLLMLFLGDGGVSHKKIIPQYIFSFKYLHCSHKHTTHKVNFGRVDCFLENELE